MTVNPRESVYDNQPVIVNMFRPCADSWGASEGLAQFRRRRCGGSGFEFAPRARPHACARSFYMHAF
eukprot:4688458-Lingulodinium_polyedra.AAC.1